ncbi:MAG: homocitrate synthase [Nitrospinae bacterium]|nr:homocitrate synthase [Nitrospinota bacterium]
MEYADTITLVDTTLRDGEQSPGIAFTVRDKVEIAGALSSIGIREIEVGTPIMGGDEAEAVKAIISLGLPARIFTWNRAVEKDIESSLSCGVKSLYVSCPVSDIQIEKKLGKTRRWVKERFLKVIPDIKKEGLYIACGLEDASRADPNFVLEVSYLLKELGVNRIRICDTVGILTPFKTFKLVQFLKERVNIPLEIHTHNDFGLATANTIAGIKGGAEYASVTVNGIGERAGNASLEEVAMILERLEGIKSGIIINRLKWISSLVSRLSGRAVPAAKPIVGDLVFSHESDLHVDGVIKDPVCYEPFPPEKVGAKRHLPIGKHSGVVAVIYKLKTMGIFLNKEDALILIPRIREIAEEKKRMLLDSELLMLYKESLNPDINFSLQDTSWNYRQPHCIPC